VKPSTRSSVSFAVFIIMLVKLTHINIATLHVYTVHHMIMNYHWASCFDGINTVQYSMYVYYMYVHTPELRSPLPMGREVSPTPCRAWVIHVLLTSRNSSAQGQRGAPRAL
jgi:hypothetical protein